MGVPMPIQMVILLTILVRFLGPLWWASQWSFCWLSESPLGGHLDGNSNAPSDGHFADHPLPFFGTLWWASQWSFSWLSECPFGRHFDEQDEAP